MAVVVSGETSYHVTSDGPSKFSKSKQEDGGRWYFSRKDIEDSSVSRKDGIDLKKETYLRKSYCTFLQDLGIRLKVPQVTIATAIVFCHRFFLRHSHAKNDRRTIATVCMFLAGKVEETPRPLKDVILVSFEIFHKKDPAAAQRIKQKEVYEQQKELILIGERVVLGTLAFDLNVQHPYKPLVEAIKKFEVAQNALAQNALAQKALAQNALAQKALVQVAWNFVNDGLRTSLCLQFKPHHIAAGAIFLAAKFLKVKLPSDGEKVWWQEFDVTPRQLEEISNQMLELYEQNGVPPPQGSEVEGNAAGGRFLAKISLNVEHGLKQASTRSATDHSLVENHDVPQSGTGNQTNDNGSAEMGSVITDHRAQTDSKDQQSEQLPLKDNNRISNRIMRTASGDQEKIGGRKETIGGERMDDSLSRKSHSSSREGHPGQPPKEVLKKIDKDKVKAALEKRKKSRGEKSYKKDVLDENDLIERELEDGVELAAEDEKNKREKKQSCSKAENQSHDEFRGGKFSVMKDTIVKDVQEENAEEGEMIDDASSMLNSRKRKSGSPPERQPDVKRRHHCDPSEDTHRIDITGYADCEQQARK